MFRKSEEEPQPLLQSAKPNGLMPCSHVEFLEDMVQVILDGLRIQVQFGRNFFVAEASPQEADHPHLPLSQANGRLQPMHLFFPGRRTADVNIGLESGENALFLIRAETYRQIECSTPYAKHCCLRIEVFYRRATWT